MQSPFSFGRAVRNESFTNREEEVKKLSSNFYHNINTIIVSPRRWGKSSLVEKVALQVRSKELKVVRIDLFSLRTEEEFYNAFGNAVIRATSNKAEEWMELSRKFIRTFTPKFTIELGDKQSFDLSLDLEAIRKHYRELLDLPEKIAQEKKINIVVCIDEFQNVSSFSNALAFQKRLRSSWQHHERVCYCLYGSKKHMMLELFNKQSHPFYRFGELVQLPKISAAKWVVYICRQFKKTGKHIEPQQAREIAGAVKDHPYYVQQLAHLVWVATIKEVFQATVKAALADMVKQNGILYFRETEELNNTELKLLRAVCAGEDKYTSKDILHRYSLGTSANVVKARRGLVAKEIADEQGGRLFFLDPVFELWFRDNVVSGGPPK